MVLHPGVVCPRLRPLPSHCLPQTLQDLQVEFFIDCLTTWNKLIMNDTLPIKKNYQHHLHITATLTCFLSNKVIRSGISLFPYLKKITLSQYSNIFIILYMIRHERNKFTGFKNNGWKHNPSMYLLILLSFSLYLFLYKSVEVFLYKLPRSCFPRTNRLEMVRLYSNYLTP